MRVKNAGALAFLKKKSKVLSWGSNNPSTDTLCVLWNRHSENSSHSVIRNLPSFIALTALKATPGSLASISCTPKQAAFSVRASFNVWVLNLHIIDTLYPCMAKDNGRYSTEPKCPVTKSAPLPFLASLSRRSLLQIISLCSK